VYFDPDSSVNNGTGFGLDLGAAYELASGLRIAAAVENLVSSMSWKDENLLYFREQYLLSQSADGTQYMDTTLAAGACDVFTNEQECPTTVRYDSSSATQRALRDSLLGNDPFATRLRLGAQLAAGPVQLAGDLTFELTDGIVPGAKQRASVGAEVPVSVVRFRGGVATDFDSGVGFSAGLGFKAGPVRIDFAGSLTPGGDRKGLAFATGISVVP